MKKSLQLGLFLFILGILSLSVTTSLKAQTDGTFTFTFTQTASGGATKNVLAVWIQDNSGVFVKTRMRYWGSGTSDHLPTWKTNSSSNTVDAATGATLKATTTPTAYGTKTVTWDGKNVSGSTVTDGTYKVLVESSWIEGPSNTHDALVSYTFVKGATSSTLTPASGNANFSGISLSWVPTTTTNINEDNSKNEMFVYPNPATNEIVLKYLNINNANVSIYSVDGKLISMDKLSSNNKIDVSTLKTGVYILKISNGEKTITKQFVKK